MQEIRCVKASELERFISLLNEIIAYSNHEIERIHAREHSVWHIEQLNGIVLPEMNELLTYAANQSVLFKYGIQQRLLESSYLLTDSLDDLHNTALGQKIRQLQKLYNTL